MNAKRNPVWRKGNRNIFCPFYTECLDHVIKRTWEDWNCDDCRYKFNYENRPWVYLTVRDSIEY
jgi:hypothetical protein